MKNKLKTRKIVAKRFKISKNGKIMRMHQNARHLRRRKSKGLLRKYARKAIVNKNMASVVKAMIPYN
jgi:large subunit ribosomal protein L35